MASAALRKTPKTNFNTKEELGNFFVLSHELFCIANDEGYFLKVNPAFIKLLGYTEEELLSRPFFDLIHPDDLQPTRAVIRDLPQTGSILNFTNRYLTKEGKYVWLSWCTCGTSTGDVLYGVAKNVTAELDQRQEIKLQQERLLRAKRMAKLGSWEYQFAPHPAAWASDELYTIYGLKREQFPHISPDVFLSFVHPDDLNEVKKNLEQIAAFTKLEYEHRFIRPDGKLIYLRHSMEMIFENGIPVRLHGVAQDITARKEAELKLELSENRFRSLVQNGYEMITIIERTGKFAYMSDSVTRILGFLQEDLIGKEIFGFIHPGDFERGYRALEQVMIKGFIDSYDPIRFLNKNGEWRWLEVTGSNMLNNPAVNGVVINCRDVTEKKALQEKLASQEEEMRSRVSKAAIKAQEAEREQLSRELHDNVNQVLTTIKLYTELALDKQMDGQTLIKKSTQYLSNCINEIRNISKRLSTPTLGKISFEDSITELVGSLNLSERLKINLKVSKLIKPLLQDTHLGIYRILQEHFTNIIKHANAKEVTLTVKVQTTGLFITVVDDGKGFDTKVRSKGIGLSNMYGRAENIQALLELRSAPGKGCTLVLTVPY
jgi:PAS domain S-box-containing protein